MEGYYGCSAIGPASMFGRSFELTDGTIILPCEFCGNPVFEVEKHTCPGLMEALVEEAERREWTTSS